MKRSLSCALLCLGAGAGAGAGEQAQPVSIDAMPPDAQIALKQHLAKRVESRLASGGLDASLAVTATNVNNPKVLLRIEEDVDRARAATGAFGEIALPAAEQAKLAQKMAARVKMDALANSGVPDDVLIDVAGVNKQQLLEKARRVNVDVTLAGKLQNAFPQHGRRLGDASAIMQYNPMTPKETKKPGAVTPGIQAGFDAALNRSKVEVDRRGFAAVGVLADISSTPYRIICSGTLISNNWFMTATHCFYDERTEGKVAWQKLGVFLPFQNGSDVLHRSSDGKQSKNMLHLPVAGNFLWFGETSNAAFPEVERDVNYQIEQGNDIALLPLRNRTGPALKVGVLTIPAASNVLPPLTMAGYGLTNAKDVVDELLLEISLRKDGFVNDPDGPLLVGASARKPDPQGRICKGDSGGPIFRGMVDGSGGAALNLVAIASMVQAAEVGSADACLDGVQKFTRLDRPAVRQWLCSKASVAC